MYCSRATTGGRVLKFIAAITLKENIACFLGWMDLPACISRGAAKYDLSSVCDKHRLSCYPLKKLLLGTTLFLF